MYFTKMQGIGNDFVMIDCCADGGEASAALAKAHAADICDRKFGVGADGVILVMPGRSAPFEMKMYNPDGSEAEMCGNGIRCFAKYICDAGLTGLREDIPVETGAGLLYVSAEADGDGLVDRVRVDMGEPILRPADVPTTLGHGDGPAINVPLAIKNEMYFVTAVSMGNPHAVLFVDDTEAFPVSVVGPVIECHPAFPRKTNTEFIQVIGPNEINFRVWERGAAETLACGTGACAAVVASVLTGRTERAVRVHLPGGDLDIEWSELDNHVYMTGPAANVFSGELPL